MSMTTSWIMEVVDQSSGAMANIGSKAEEMGTKIETSAAKSSVSLSEVGRSISGVATSAFAMYQLYDRVDDATLRVNTAQNRLEDAARRVRFAQTDLNAAIEKYGPGSDQAAEAAERLKAAQDDLALAGERAQEAQERYNESIFLSATMAIPTAITAFSSLKALVLTITPALSGVSAGAAAAATAMVGFAAGVGAVIGTMVGLGASIVAWKDQTGEWHSATEKVIERLQGFPPIIKEVTEFLAKAAGGWLIAFDKLREGCVSFGGAVVDFAGQVQNAFSGVSSAISSAVSSIGSVLSSAASAISSIWSSIISAIASGVSSIVSAVSSGFSSLINIVSSIFSGIWGIITGIMSGIVSYIWGVINSIISAFQSLWRAITGGSIWPEMFESMEKQAAEGMKGIQSVVAGGLGEVTPVVKAAAGEAAAGPTTRNITINFTIQGVTDPDEVARQVENRLVEVLSRRSEVTAG